MKRLVVTGTLVAAALLGGCASAPERANLGVQTPVAVARTQPGSVHVNVPPVSAGIIAVPEAELKAAIEDSIRKSNAFREVVSAGGATYELTVSVVTMKTPLFGISMTVDVETAWSLVRASDRQPVLQRTFTATHTTGGGEAFAGAVRARMALEGAVRKTIEQGLLAIGQLSL